jgi:hypothetical protein
MNSGWWKRPRLQISCSGTLNYSIETSQIRTMLCKDKVQKLQKIVLVNVDKEFNFLKVNTKFFYFFANMLICTVLYSRLDPIGLLWFQSVGAQVLVNTQGICSR